MPRIHVFDTYATCKTGRIMHFDVVLAERNDQKALASAHDWLASLGEPDAAVSHERCAYCHSEDQAPPEIEREISERGYAIYRLEGCPPPAP
jgi:hypothetical protein